MSLSNALNSALSGLSASSAMVDVIASNTANALTAGYAPREVSLSARSLGGNGSGVRVEGVVRSISPSLLQEKWLTDAKAAAATLHSAFYSRIESLTGVSGDYGALQSRLADFDARLLEAASLPESTAYLDAAVEAAAAVVTKINDIATGIQAARLDADHAIARDVDMLNTTLQQVEHLNRAITRAISSGADANGLKDQRQALIDRIAEIVPLRSLPRAGEQIAIYSTGGQVLLDGDAVTIGFSPAGVMTADMSMESGALSGLTVNGRAVSTAANGPFAGGTLSAAFDIRDRLATVASSNIDALARNLLERFASPSVDPTLVAGAAGLFTDAGAAGFNPDDETGLAGRLRLNAAMDPEEGGATWRLRDGIGATVQGSVGDATLLNALEASLQAALPIASGSFSAGNRNVSELAADFLSFVAIRRLNADSELAYASARNESATEHVLQQGVDTDAELQKLLQVEQSYAANARVIQTLGALMDLILEI